MSHEEAKTILLLYRPGTADGDDPRIAAALETARRDPDLSRWLEQHLLRQETLHAKFRQIPIPAGLKDQIISEREPVIKPVFWKRPVSLPVALAAAVAISLVALGTLWVRHRQHNNDSLPAFTDFQYQMGFYATHGYAMELVTNDAAQVRDYLQKKGAPSDYQIPAGLGKATLAGCAVWDWGNTKVSMLCFRTGKPLPAGAQSDLWLFVIDDKALKKGAETEIPQFSASDTFYTAAWTQSGKLYLLGAVGDQETVKKFL